MGKTVRHAFAAALVLGALILTGCVQKNGPRGTGMLGSETNVHYHGSAPNGQQTAPVSK